VAAAAKNSEQAGQQRGAVPELPDPERRVTLTSLVSDYLSNKHALCKNPMTTCPEFDLFLPHRCPDKRSKRAAPLNLAARMGCKSVFPRHGGPDGAKLDRKLLYSRFKPVKSFRAGGEDRENNVFTCTAFSGDGQFLLAGTGMGDLKMFNILSGGRAADMCFSFPS
jgi:HIV-1 Vpr-binding protein